MANNTEKILNNPLVMIFAVILAILIIFSLRQSQEKALISKENLSSSQKYLDQLSDRVQQKKNNLDLINDDLYKEKIQRNELLKQRPGEIILQVPINNEQDLQQSETNRPTTNEKKNSYWQLWRQLLF